MFLQLGNRDIAHAGTELTTDAIAGAAAKYVARAEMDEGVQFQIAEDIGVPSNMLDDDTHVGTYQRSSVGHRFYGNNLGAAQGRTGSNALQHSHPRPRQSPVIIAASKRRLAMEAAQTTHVASNVVVPFRNPHESFGKRCIQNILRDTSRSPDDMRRKRRIVKQLSESNGNMSRSILQSYETNGSPEHGQSQEAVSSMLLFAETPDQTKHNKSDDNDDD